MDVPGLRSVIGHRLEDIEVDFHAQEQVVEGRIRQLSLLEVEGAAVIGPDVAAVLVAPDAFNNAVHGGSPLASVLLTLRAAALLAPQGSQLRVSTAYTNRLGADALN